MHRLTRRGFTKLRDAVEDVDIGGEVTLSGSRLMDFRDAAFVYIDGHVYVGSGPGEMHEDLIRAHVPDEDEAFELTQGRFGFENAGETPFAAGYMVGDSAVLLAASVQGCTQAEVVAALTALGLKVLVTDHDDVDDDVHARRVARRLRR